MRNGRFRRSASTPKRNITHNRTPGWNFSLTTPPGDFTGFVTIAGRVDAQQYWKFAPLDTEFL